MNTYQLVYLLSERLEGALYWSAAGLVVAVVVAGWMVAAAIRAQTRYFHATDGEDRDDAK